MASGLERNVFAELKPIFLASLREEFDSLFPASSLASLLSKVEVQQKLRHMRKTGLLSTDEWQDLLPTSETQGNSTTFDVPLLFKLIREFSDLEPPVTGWDDVARHNDHSLSADIVKIVQCYRTLCGQSDGTELRDSVVRDNLSIMEDVLERRSPVNYNKFKLLLATKIQLNPKTRKGSSVIYDKFLPPLSTFKPMHRKKEFTKKTIPEATQSTSTKTDLQPTTKAGVQEFKKMRAEMRKSTEMHARRYQIARYHAGIDVAIPKNEKNAAFAATQSTSTETNLQPIIIAGVQEHKEKQAEIRKSIKLQRIRYHIEPRYHGIDAAIPKIKRDAFEPEYSITRRLRYFRGKASAAAIPKIKMGALVATHSTSTKKEPQPIIKAERFREYEKMPAEIGKSIKLQRRRYEFEPEDSITRKSRYPRGTASAAAIPEIERDEFEPEDSITRKSRYPRGTASAAAIPEIERDEFEPEDSITRKDEPQPIIKAERFREYEKMPAEIGKSIKLQRRRYEFEPEDSITRKSRYPRGKASAAAIPKIKMGALVATHSTSTKKEPQPIIKAERFREYEKMPAVIGKSIKLQRRRYEFEPEDSITRKSRYNRHSIASAAAKPKIETYEFAATHSTSTTKTKPQPTNKAGVHRLPSRHSLLSFIRLALSREESSLCECGSPSVMLKALKTRHASVTQASQFDSNQQLKRRKKLINYVIKLSLKHTNSLRLLPKGHTSGIRYKSIADMNYVLGKLGLDSDSTLTLQFEKFRLTDRQISEDEVIPAYLKESSRQIQALHQRKDRVYCVVPYHYSGQTAVVIYAHDPTADLYKKDWSGEFLGFPVFIVDLTYGYKSDSLIFLECLPQIPEDTYVKCSKVKDEVTRELTKKHSNISSICVDYRIKINKIVAGEICIQIGVLTKGFVPLGEKCLPKVFEDVAVDVIESNASFCVLPDLRVYPVNLGVGIGVKGDGSSTGSLGAVVKLNEQPNELFILSNAHVLYREDKGATLLSITQPSQQEYEKKKVEIETTIEMYVSDIEQLENIIEQRQTLGQSVRRQEEELTKRKQHLQESKDNLQYIFDKQRPRTIGSFTAKTGSFVRNPMYLKKPRYYGIDSATPKIEEDKFEPEDGMTIEPKCYGIDAAIAKIEIRDNKFATEAITKMYTWPVEPYLVDEKNNNIEEIQLNGELMDEQTISHSLKEKVTVFKCGKGTGVTKGVLYTEMNVRITGEFDNFIQVGSHTVSNASDDLWYNVLHIKSTTKRGDRDTRSFSEPGDSGAVVFDESGTCVGLLFGKIDTQHYQGGGLATPIHAVLEALKISLAKPDDLKHLLKTEKKSE